ncbi:MAG: glycosyltransferase, partial [Clostridiaceae bacterium]|nr:glycosyltransferase [Clostridiaceae bacterium]
MHNYNILITTMRLDIGGAETHIVELAKGLSRAGFNVIVASAGGVYEKELERSGIKVYHVPLDNKKPHNVIKAYYQLNNIIKEN